MDPNLRNSKLVCRATGYYYLYMWMERRTSVQIIIPCFHIEERGRRRQRQQLVGRENSFKPTLYCRTLAPGLAKGRWIAKFKRESVLSSSSETGKTMLHALAVAPKQTKPTILLLIDCALFLLKFWWPEILINSCLCNASQQSTTVVVNEIAFWEWYRHAIREFICCRLG